MLSSFGTEKLKDVKDDEINKMQEAIDRIRLYFKIFSKKISQRIFFIKIFSHVNKDESLESKGKICEYF